MSRRESVGVPANAAVLTSQRGASGGMETVMDPVWVAFFEGIAGRTLAVGDLIATAQGIGKRDGYLRCNGASYRATEYPDLAAALGGAGADGMFRVPTIAPANFAGVYWIRAR